MPKKRGVFGEKMPLFQFFYDLSYTKKICVIKRMTNEIIKENKRKMAKNKENI